MSTTSHDVVVLVGNPRAGSRTRAVAERIASLVEPSPAVVLDLADLTGITYAAKPASAAAPNEAAIDQVGRASVLIVASPAYKGTYTGLLKLFLDRLPHRGLADVIALPVAVAGSPAHAAATAADLVRVLEELGARVPAKVALLESELEHPDLGDVVDVISRARRSPAA